MIFQKKEGGEQHAGSDAATIVAAGTSVLGDFTCSNHLRIDGHIEGDIVCDSKVVIGQNGSVSGAITCTLADVSGKLFGDIIVAESLVLRKGAVINGNIQANLLQMEAGVTFNGKCQMGAKTTAEQITKPKKPVLVPNEVG
jgi:cytoskeletal protein CcmA (bactofilin family)